MAITKKSVSLLILSIVLPWTGIAGQISGLETAQASAEDSDRYAGGSTSGNGPPELTVLLTPLFAAESITSVHVSISYEPRPEINATSGLFQGATTAASIPALDIEEGSLQVFNAAGPLNVTPRDVAINGYFLGYRWATDRPTKGSVNISYTAMPRSVSNTERNGPVLDFRLESGGLLASGFSLLVAPVDLEQDYHVSLDWNLCNGPIGTKGIWTWGPSSAGPIVRRMTSFEILWTFFAAGPVQAYIDEVQAGIPARFNVYWLGELPFDGDELSGQIGQLFRDMSDFFEDDGESYRVFLRHNSYPGTNSGTALQRLFIFCYDDSDYSHSGGNLDRVMAIAYEMVHNWVIWDSSVDLSAHGLMTPEEYCYVTINSIYFRCVYDHLFPFVIGSGEKYVQRINGWLLAYYTSEYSYMSLNDANRDMWMSSAAQKVPYRRGHAFAMQLDAAIRAASQSRASLDDLVLHLVRINKLGQSAGPEEFDSVLGNLIGSKEQALRLVEAMKSGTHLVIPPTDALSAGRFHLPATLRRHDFEQFQLGFDEYRRIRHENENEWHQVELWPRATFKVENWGFDLIVESEL
ncbi:hypothetical protein G7054_g10829 [Neopestalotiopsis clavispora]|nr:hypothetical protein G7054_g10829 [Neopestalotiopsis clavispora]